MRPACFISAARSNQDERVLLFGGLLPGLQSQKGGPFMSKVVVHVEQLTDEEIETIIADLELRGCEQHAQSSGCIAIVERKRRKLPDDRRARIEEG